MPHAAQPVNPTDAADAVTLTRWLDSEIKLREATLDVFTSLGSWPTRDLQFQVSDLAGSPAGAAIQPPWYVQNQKLGEVIPVYRSEVELRYIRDRSRVMAYNNEFALCALENRANYVVGDGFKYSATPTDPRNKAHQKSAECVQAVIDCWHEINDLPTLEAETLWRLDVEGEAFIRDFPDKKGWIHHRFVEPEHVTNNGADMSDPALSFGVVTDADDVETVHGYMVIEDPLTETVATKEVDAKKLHHFKLNTRRGSKRGLPTFYPVEANLRRCEELLASMTSLAKTRAKIALIRKVTGLTSATADSLLNKLTAIRATDPASGEVMNVERWRNGTVLTASGNTDYEFPSIQLGASDIVEVLQAELRAIASRLVMPEWMFTALADAKYSNAFVCEAPTLKAFRKLQRTLRTGFGLCRYGHRASLLWRQLQLAVVAGLLTPDDLENVTLGCEGPSLEARDRAGEVTRHKEMVESGFESKETAQRSLELDPDVETPLIHQEQVGKARPVADMSAVSQLQQAFYGGKLPRDAAAASLMVLMGFSRDQAEALLPASDCKKRTDDGAPPSGAGVPGAPGTPPGAAPGQPPGDDAGKPAAGDDADAAPGSPPPGATQGAGDADPADALLNQALGATREQAAAHQEGDVWQGESGGWFTLTDGHVQPAPAPGGAVPAPGGAKPAAAAKPAPAQPGATAAQPGTGDAKPAPLPAPKAPPPGAELENSKLGKHLHANVQIRHTADGDWVVKGRNGKKAAVQNEAVVSALARANGLNVPLVHHVQMYGQDQAVVELVKGKALVGMKPDERKAALAKVPRADLEKNALFDYLIGSSDPNNGNYMIGDDGSFVAIDKERSLRYGEIKDKATFRVPYYLEDAPPPKATAGEHEFAPETVKEMADTGAALANKLKEIGRGADAKGVERRAAVLRSLSSAGKPVKAADVMTAGHEYDKTNPAAAGVLGKVKSLFGW